MKFVRELEPNLFIGEGVAPKGIADKFALLDAEGSLPVQFAVHRFKGLFVGRSEQPRP